MGRPFLGVIMWKNAKYIGQFKGGYERDKDGERVFVLRSTINKTKKTFESWQMAKNLGWIKVK